MKIAFSVPATAASMSASCSTTTGDLPPSSSVTDATCSAADFMICLPVSTEPVNVTCATSGWLTSGTPASWPNPVTTL
jgi:hypothetical protein